MKDRKRKFIVRNGLIGDDIEAMTATEALEYFDRLRSLVSVTVVGPNGPLTHKQLECLAYEEQVEQSRKRASRRRRLFADCANQETDRVSLKKVT